MRTGVLVRALGALVPALGALLLASTLLLGRGVAIPDVAVACSCIAPQALELYSGPDTAIFAGQVIGDDPDGIRVAVEQWFSGTGAAPIILISGDFGNGASCGVGARPPVGSRWIWVAWRPQDEEGIPNPFDGGVQINICQPFADLSTPEGEALLQEAIATFGGSEAPTGGPSAVPSNDAGSPAATVAPTAAPGATTVPPAEAGPSGEAVALVATAGVLLVGAALLVAVLLLGRRGRRADGELPH